MAVPCFINGTGLVTCQGVGVKANWQNLLAGRVLHQTGIVPLPRDPSLPRVSQLAIIAAREALSEAGNPDLDEGRIALVVGTSKGPIEDWLDQLNGQRLPDLSLGLSRVANDISHAVGHGRGPRLTLAGACASGLHAIIRAMSLIQEGTCDAALVVGAEASTHALFRANFSRLGVLADPADGCRPFDVHRTGFLLAEAAAAVWITKDPAGRCVRIVEGAAYADATHLTGTDRNAATLKHLLCKLSADSCELVHAHGTGTSLNDATEIDAIYKVCSSVDQHLYSHKHAVGHTQGAAGVISTVLNVEMHKRSIALGNSNSGNTICSPDRPKTSISQHPRNINIRRSVAIAAGFGGTIAGLILSGDD